MTTAIRRARITAAARALCKATSAEVGIEEERNWKLNSDLFVADATTAIKAADKVAKAEAKVKADAALVKKAEGLIKKVEVLQEQVNFYRKRFGVVALCDQLPNDYLLKIEQVI